MHAAGKLKIVASADLGDLGPAEAEPIYYTWNPLYNMLGLIPWLLLAGAFVLLKENRKWQALWILVPVLMFKLVCTGVFKMLGAPSEAILYIDVFCSILTFGLALVWLLGDRIGGRNRFVTWLLAAAVCLLMAGLGVVNLGFDVQSLLLSLVTAVFLGTLLLALTLAAFTCRKYCGPVRFFLGSALFILVTCSLAMFTIISIQFTYMGSSITDNLKIVMIASLSYSGILAGIYLPFHIVLFASGFWRSRFEKVFGIPTRRPKKEQAIMQSEPEVSTT